MGSTASRSNSATLVSVLLDFEASPGRFPIRLREPRLLFERAAEVLQLATGRLTAPSESGSPSPHTVQRAARAFVRHAFLRQGADHYALLGLYADATESTIREHYRLLIRLTHPDFETAADPWPSDTAARVNLAYGVLSSPDQRASYDLETKQQTASTGRPVNASPRPSGKPAAKALGSRRPRPGPRMSVARQWLIRHKTYFASVVSVLAGLALLVLFLVSAPSREESLRAVPMPASTAPRTSRDARLAQEVASLEASLAALSHRPTDAAPAPVTAPARSSATNAIGAKSECDRRPAPSLATAPPAPFITEASASMAGPPAPVKFAVDARPENSPLALGLSRSLPSTKPANTVVSSLGSPVAAIASATLAPPLLAPRPVAIPTTEKAFAGHAAPVDMKPLQPLFAGLIETLVSGNSNRVLRWTECSSLRSDSAPAFAEAYKKALGTARVLGLGQVSLSPQSLGELQMVSGVVQIRLQHPDLRTSVKSFRLRAYVLKDATGIQLADMVAE
jgi:hypothetical protein